MQTPLTQVSGIGPAAAEQLNAGGIKSAEELAQADVSTITAIPGFGEVRAARAKRAAADALANIESEPASASEPETIENEATQKNAHKAKKKNKKEKPKGEKSKTDKKAEKKKKKKKNKG